MKCIPKTLFSFFVLAISTSASLFAQLDTLGFPLEVGDKWYYRRQEINNNPSNPTNTTYVLIKEITAITGDTAHVRVSDLQTGVLGGPEIWIVRNGNFYLDLLPLYRGSLTHDSSWSGVMFSYKASVTLGRVTIFGSNNKCQILQTSEFDGIVSHADDYRVALGIGYYYHQEQGFGEWSFSGTSKLIALFKNGVMFGDTTITAVQSISTIPHALELYQNYPNPCNPTTKIEFQISKADHVVLTLYNILGQEFTSLLDNHLQEGSYIVEFNSTKLSSGVYFYRLESNGRTLIRKMLVLK